MSFQWLETTGCVAPRASRPIDGIPMSEGHLAERPQRRTSVRWISGRVKVKSERESQAFDDRRPPQDFRVPSQPAEVSERAQNEQKKEAGCADMPDSFRTDVRFARSRILNVLENFNKTKFLIYAGSTYKKCYLKEHNRLPTSLADFESTLTDSSVFDPHDSYQALALEAYRVYKPTWANVKVSADGKRAEGMVHFQGFWVRERHLVLDAHD